MEPTPARRSILNHLAYIYIALAHRTDDDISHDEVKAITQCLQQWEDVSTVTVAAALKSALESYVNQVEDEHLDAALSGVKAALGPEERRKVLDDLSQVALADGRFLYEESAFIGRISRAWDVQTGLAENLPAEQPWSILPLDAGSDWTLLHDLALIYVALARSSDERLSEEEAELIGRKLAEWAPDAPAPYTLEIVQTVVGASAGRTFDEAVEAVRRGVPAHQLPALFDDLTSIASADGEVVDGEQALIRRLAAAWGARRLV